MVWVPKPVWDESSGPQLCNQPSPTNWPRWVTPGSLIWDCSLFSRYLALDYQVSSFSHRPLRHRPCPRDLISAGDSFCRSHCPSESPSGLEDCESSRPVLQVKLLVFTRAIWFTFWMNLLLPVPSLVVTRLGQSTVCSISLSWPSISADFTAVLSPSEIFDALLSLPLSPFRIDSVCITSSFSFLQTHRIFCCAPDTYGRMLDCVTVVCG